MNLTFLHLGEVGIQEVHCYSKSQQISTFVRDRYRIDRGILFTGTYRDGSKGTLCNSLREFCTLLMRNGYPAYA